MMKPAVPKLDRLNLKHLEAISPEVPTIVSSPTEESSTMNVGTLVKAFEGALPTARTPAPLKNIRKAATEKAAAAAAAATIAAEQRAPMTLNATSGTNLSIKHRRASLPPCLEDSDSDFGTPRPAGEGGDSTRSAPAAMSRFEAAVTPIKEGRLSSSRSSIPSTYQPSQPSSSRETTPRPPDWWYNSAKTGKSSTVLQLGRLGTPVYETETPRSEVTYSEASSDFGDAAYASGALQSGRASTRSGQDETSSVASHRGPGAKHYEAPPPPLSLLAQKLQKSQSAPSVPQLALVKHRGLQASHSVPHLSPAPCRAMPSYIFCVDRETKYITLTVRDSYDLYGRLETGVVSARAAIKDIAGKVRELNAEDGPLKRNRSSSEVGVMGAVGGGALGATAGGSCGAVTGAGVGAIVGLAAAPFTLGLSVPIGASLGTGAGLCIGATTGAAVGTASGGTMCYVSHKYRRLPRALVNFVKGSKGSAEP
eukprot:TRINITY_DN42002_c0_g1_i1.p1 TRINITY_DN42002_c0_g1~~TRINITY_DN42002_c0_g1_i1.p1  ORF type:complete len:480 (-),score=92.26 TRINITY_DN42002_c0_g1_i1:77-1516(-)